jgi:diguanylate cyclase (GGDEF)-like protein/PAS domain S-box-containing protein
MRHLKIVNISTNWLGYLGNIFINGKIYFYEDSLMGRNPWITLVTALPQILSLILIVILAIVTWQKHTHLRWAAKFLLVLFSLAIWDVADILELFSNNVWMYYAVIKFAYIGIATLPLFWFLFIVAYTGNDSWFSPGKLFLCAIIPFLTIIFTFTDELHHLMRTVISYDPSGQLSIAKIQFGIWFWVHSINSYLFLFLALFLLIRTSVAASGLYLGQKVFLVLASLAPWVCNILYLTKVTSSDYTSSAFTLLSLALFVSVFRYQLMNLVPIARDIVIENMNDAVIVLDKENRIIDINSSARGIFRYASDNFIGKTIQEIFPYSANMIEDNLEKETVLNEIGLPFNNPTKYYTVQITNIKSKKNDLLGKVVVFRDSTEQKTVQLALQDINRELESRVKERTSELMKELEARKSTELALRESEERFSLAIQGANDGLWDWNLKTNEVFYSPRWKSMLGYEVGEIEPNPEAWFSKVHLEDIDLLHLEISRHLDSSTPQFQYTNRLIRKDGSLIWVLCRGLAKRDGNGIAIRMSGSLTDITQQKNYEEQILHDAYHDALTGLPNRAFLVDRITHAINRAKRKDNEQYAIIFLDLDRFKNINDGLGHSIGDQLLEVCGQRLLGCIRTIDTIARLGGDEFVILLDIISDLQEVEVVASRISRKLSKPIVLENHEVSITASIGIVLFTDQYEKAEEVLRDADIAMYQAKRNTLKRYEFFIPEMREKVNNRLELEIELRHGLEFDEFELFFQPIVKIENKKLVSFEALIRWNQPLRGFVMPSDFIPIAEETGLILPIGQWVIHEVCHQVSLWKKMVPSDIHISINFNLSARQFSDANLCDKIRDFIQEYEIEGNNLVLEITESAIIEDQETVLKMLKSFKTLGIQIHLDDFGTGYSSLSYLHNIPFDAFKIDRSFVTHICDDEDCSGTEIIQTIISLGRELNKKVVAEGVETQDELDKLNALGCGYVQGYLISKPMNRVAAEAFLLQESCWPNPVIEKRE